MKEKDQEIARLHHQITLSVRGSDQQVVRLQRQLTEQQAALNAKDQEAVRLHHQIRELLANQGVVGMEVAELKCQIAKLQAALDEKIQEVVQLEAEKGVEVDQLQGEVHALRRQAPKEDVRGSPLDFYDVVINLQRLQDVYKGGWPVCYLDEGKFNQFRQTTAGFVVSITGDFNVGKSWIISQLAGRVFQSGDRVHTVGISIKSVNLAEQTEPEADPSEKVAGPSLGKKAYFIDTQGLNSPVTTPKLEQAGQVGGVSTMEQELQAMKAMEEFQRQVVLSVSDVFLFVVGQLSAKNQLDLHLLIKAIKVLRKRFRSNEQRVFVVHNLRDWTHQQFEHEKYVERLQAVYGDTLHQAKSYEGFNYLWGAFKEDTETSMQKISFEHLFLTRAGAPGCQNDKVFTYIRNTLRSTQLEDSCLADRLGDAMYTWLPSFLQMVDSAPAPKLTIVDREVNAGEDLVGICSVGQRIGWYSPVENLGRPFTTAVRTRPLGSIVSLASDDLAYNLSEIPCMVKTIGNPQCRIMRLLSIEVPGLMHRQFNCVVNSVHSSQADVPENANLVVVTMDGDGDVVEVRLKAILESNPSDMNEALQAQDEKPPDGLQDEEVLNTTKLYRKFEQSSFGVAFGMEKYHCKVIDKGNRSIDRGNHCRSVNFRMGFSEQELKWDCNYGPYYCYSNGMLSVGFVTQKKFNGSVADYLVDESGMDDRSELPR